jgi:hypothetical protein
MAQTPWQTFPPWQPLQFRQVRLFRLLLPAGSPPRCPKQLAYQQQLAYQ